jgi:hypothetical protein
MFICNSAHVFVGHWSIEGASVTHAVWSGEVEAASDFPAGAAAAGPAWGGSLVVPHWIPTRELVGRVGEVWFGPDEVRQVLFERVDRTVAFFRGMGPPPPDSGRRPTHG